MASPAFKHTDIQAFEFPVRTNFRSLAELTSSLRNVSGFSKEQPESSVPASTGQRGAKAAMVAIGLEVAAALCFYGIWQVWVLLR